MEAVFAFLRAGTGARPDLCTHPVPVRWELGYARIRWVEEKGGTASPCSGLEEDAWVLPYSCPPPVRLKEGWSMVFSD